MDSSGSGDTLTSRGPAWTWGSLGVCWAAAAGSCEEEKPRKECSHLLRQGCLLLSNIQNPLFLNFERLGRQEAVTFLCKPCALSLALLSLLPCHAGDVFSSCILYTSVSFDLPVCLLKICMFKEE